MPYTQVPKWKLRSDSYKTKKHRSMHKIVSAWNLQCILAVEKMALLSSIYRAITLCETKVVTSCWVDQAIYQVHMPTCSHTADLKGCKSLWLMPMNVSKSLKKLRISMLMGQDDQMSCVQMSNNIHIIFNVKCSLVFKQPCGELLFYAKDMQVREWNVLSMALTYHNICHFIKSTDAMFLFTHKEIYLLFYAKERVKFTLQNLVAPLNSTHVHKQITK